MRLALQSTTFSLFASSLTADSFTVPVLFVCLCAAPFFTIRGIVNRKELSSRSYVVYTLVIASALVAALAASHQLKSGSALVGIVGKLISFTLWVVAFVLSNDKKAWRQAAAGCVLLVLMTVFLWAVRMMPFCLFTATCFSSLTAKHLFFYVALLCGYASFVLFTRNMEPGRDMQMRLNVFNCCVWPQVVLHILYYWLGGGLRVPISFLVAILHCLQIVCCGHLLLPQAHKSEGPQDDSTSDAGASLGASFGHPMIPQVQKSSKPKDDRASEGLKDDRAGDAGAGASQWDATTAVSEGSRSSSPSPETCV